MGPGRVTQQAVNHQKKKAQAHHSCGRLPRRRFRPRSPDVRHPLGFRMASSRSPTMGCTRPVATNNGGRPGCRPSGARTNARITPPRFPACPNLSGASGVPFRFLTPTRFASVFHPNTRGLIFLFGRGGRRGGHGCHFRTSSGVSPCRHFEVNKGWLAVMSFLGW